MDAEDIQSAVMCRPRANPKYREILNVVLTVLTQQATKVIAAVFTIYIMEEEV